MYGKPVDPTFPNRDFDVLDATAEIQEMLYPYLSQAIQNYNTIISKENSFESFISTASVTRCCQVRFNRYKKNTLMRTHHDHIHNLFDGEQKGIPILSIVGLLNNDFSGGDFIFFDNYNVKLTAGDVMIFPSSFLYPHRVEEITSGTRHAFVSWAY
jgi:predicted 2-oxoglutarate/Fe(II)-dependent dioxygenase YbiX